MDSLFDVSWIDRGREPQSPPDPKYPDGVDADASGGAAQTCKVMLPYPARRCGYHTVVCKVCGTSGVITTAGRPDDPRSIKVACKKLVNV